MRRDRRGGSGSTEAGDHPTLEELAAYHGDRLGPDEELEVQEHLVRCRECARVVLELDEFATPVADAQARWYTPRRAARALLSFPSGWAVAAGLLVVLVAGGLLVHRQGRQPTLNVPVVALEPPTRGATVGGQPLFLPPGTDRFVLVLVPSEPPDGGTLSLEISGPEGEEVWAGSGLEPSAGGAVTLDLPRALLPDGSYRLRLRSAGGVLVEDFEVRIATR